MIDVAIEAGIDIHLRVPHTSHRTQRPRCPLACRQSNSEGRYRHPLQVASSFDLSLKRKHECKISRECLAFPPHLTPCTTLYENWVVTIERFSTCWMLTIECLFAFPHVLDVG